MTRTEDAVARLREVRGLRENPLPIASSSNERLWNAALDGWWGVTAQPILALGIVMPRGLPRLAALLSWTTLLGVGTAATGLAWDSILHARNPLLAQHEGILTASNPAHILLAGGLMIALAAQIGGMCQRLPGTARRAFVAGSSLFLLGIGAALGWSYQVSASQTAAAQRFMASAREGILKYRDPSVAVKAGYEPVTPQNWPMVEWVNPVYTAAGRVLDLKRPERLMYISAPGGPMLAGEMFVLPDARTPPPSNVAGGLAHWHQHRDLCYLPNGTIVGTNGYGTPCPTGSTARPTPEMLHVWIVPNPAGAFAEDMSPAAIASVIAHE